MTIILTIFSLLSFLFFTFKSSNKLKRINNDSRNPLKPLNFEILKQKGFLNVEKNYIYIFGKKEKFNDNFSNNKNHLSIHLYNILYDYINDYQKEFCLKNNFKNSKILIKNVKTYEAQNWVNENKIAYNIELIFYTKNYINYVIMHELCHQRVQNHSKDFYNELKKYCLDYNNIKSINKEWRIKLIFNNIYERI